MEQKFHLRELETELNSKERIYRIVADVRKSGSLYDEN